MSHRITAKFQELASKNQTGFIAYITAGDPHPDVTTTLVHAMERSGVDVVELGIPFSDPLADGATIQAAAGRATAAGTTVARVLAIVRQIRETSEIPLVLFTYLNPIFAYGFEAFQREATAAGADGLLILDLPPDEAARNPELARSQAICAIQLIAPTTPPSRMALIANSAEGFIYYVSREGVTGEQTSVSSTIADQVAHIRAHTSLPIAVGFGISTPAQAAEVAKHADAVVVGSAIVRHLAEQPPSSDLAAALESFVRPLVQAVKK